MIPGFNMAQPQATAAPFQMITPEVLAQMAAQGFRPPGLGGGGPGFQMPQGGGGMDMAGGMAGLGMGLGALRGMGGPTAGGEQGAVGPGGLSGAVSGINALKPDASGVWQQPKMPTDIAYGQGGSGSPDFLTGVKSGFSDLWNWLKR